LQIQGDDIVLHTKKPISSEQRKKICEWQLIKFNYLSVENTVQPDKEMQKEADEATSF
jgi:hypothetical protein